MRLNSLKKKDVFGHMIKTPYDVKTSGYKWVFWGIEILRYKADVAQGFSQRPVIDYEETYSQVVDATTFRFFISLAI